MSAYGGVFVNKGGQEVVVSLAACHQGQTRAGVEHSWIALASDFADATFVDFRDERKFKDPVRGSHLMSRNILQAMDDVKSHTGADVPQVCFGGDHTVSIGTLQATRKQHPKTHCIWIDAHPDINCHETSLSGNCHGMPVAHVMGMVPEFNMVNPFQPSEFAYIGLRMIDDAEAVRLAELKTKGCLIYYADDVRTRGIAPILAEIKAAWGTAGKEEFDFPVHISLDVDSIDPEFTPATGTPVPDGIHPNDVLETVRFVNKHSLGGLSHIDVVEINPYLATAAEAAKTTQTSQAIMKEWLATHRLLGVKPTVKSAECDNATPSKPLPSRA